MTTTTPPTSQRPPSAPAPLAPVIAVVFLGSLGTGAVTNGVFFVTSQKYDFTPIANLALGFSLGAVYILGALAIGPFSRALAARHASISTRNVAAAVMLLLGLLCAVPLLIARPWAMWLFTLAYIPFTGAVWPIAESYISGGRRGPELRRAIGVFNLAWASAVAASFWG
ncbi:MAG: hypothetical protein VYC34_09545, partial [Planctomycetota bacterium]|nr:hypothetical protein [Planctomycetota bacterium]